MNNLRSSLYILALVSLICLFAPSGMLAQEDGEPPCCYNAPPTGPTLPNIEIQNGISLLAGTSVQIDAFHPIAVDIGRTTEIVAAEKPRLLMVPKGNFDRLSTR